MTNKKIQKALSNLNAYIDDDRQRLCDRIKNLEKSHRRMMCLLRKCKIEFFDVLDKCPRDSEVSNPYAMLARVQLMIEILDDELNRTVL